MGKYSKRIHKKTLVKSTAVLLVAIFAVSSVAFRPIQTDGSAAGNALADLAEISLAQRVVQPFSAFFERHTTFNGAYNDARSQIRRQNYEQALSYTRRAIELYDGANNNFLAHLWHIKTALHIRLGDYNDGLYASNTVIQLDPTNTEIYLLRAQAFSGLAEYNNRQVLALRLGAFEHEMQRGHEALVAEDFAAASDAFTRAIETEPYLAGSIGLFYLRGESYFKQSMYAEAARDFRASADNGAFYYESIFNYAISTMMYLDGLNAAALENIRRVAEMDGNAEVQEKAIDFLNALAIDIAASHTAALVISGRAYLFAGNAAAAIDAFTEAAAANPNYPGLSFYKGAAFFALERFAEAAEAFNASLRAGYMVHNSYFNLGVSLIMNNNDAGFTYLALAAEMDDDEAIQALAIATLSDVTDVLVSVTEAHTLSPALDELLAGLQAVQTEDFEEAEAAFSRAIAMDNTLAGVTYYRGITRFALEDFEGAVADFRMSMEQEYLYHSSLHNAAVGLLMRNDEMGIAYLARAAEMDDDEEVQQRSAELLRLIEAGINYIPAVVRHLLNGIEAMQAGQYQLAEAEFIAAMQEDAHFPGLIYYLGVARFEMGMFELAAADFRAAAASGYMVHNAVYNLGVSLIMMEHLEHGSQYIRIAADMDDDEMVQAIARALIRDIEDARHEFTLVNLLVSAQAYADIGDFEGMIGYLHQYILAVPDDFDILLVLAQALFALGYYEDAIEQARLAWPHTKNVEAQYIIALASLQLYDFAATNAAMTYVIDYEPGRFFGAWYYRGVARLSLERFREAEADFTASIEHNEMHESSLLNRGIARLMMNSAAGMADIRMAARAEDETVAQQAAILLEYLDD